MKRARRTIDVCARLNIVGHACPTCAGTFFSFGGAKRNGRTRHVGRVPADTRHSGALIKVRRLLCLRKSDATRRRFLQLARRMNGPAARLETGSPTT